MDREIAFRIVYEAIDVVNGQRAPDAQLVKSPDVIFAGENGALDSLALTTLVLGVERKVKEVTGKEIDILASAIVEDGISALRTPSALVEIILQQVA
jgi:hypothetical protein